jgi:hypothetical protein
MKISPKKVVAFITGFVLILMGGVTFTVTTIPGVALVVYSITGKK